MSVWTPLRWCNLPQYIEDTCTYIRDVVTAALVQMFTKCSRRCKAWSKVSVPKILKTKCKLKWNHPASQCWSCWIKHSLLWETRPRSFDTTSDSLHSESCDVSISRNLKALHIGLSTVAIHADKKGQRGNFNTGAILFHHALYMVMLLFVVFVLHLEAGFSWGHSGKPKCNHVSCLLLAENHWRIVGRVFEQRCLMRAVVAYALVSDFLSHMRRSSSIYHPKHGFEEVLFAKTPPQHL